MWNFGGMFCIIINPVRFKLYFSKLGLFNILCTTNKILILHDFSTEPQFKGLNQPFYMYLVTHQCWSCDVEQQPDIPHSSPSLFSSQCIIITNFPLFLVFIYYFLWVTVTVHLLQFVQTEGRQSCELQRSFEISATLEKKRFNE